MQEMKSFVSGRAFLMEKPDSVLIPFALCVVSCGFPSPADDYIETSIDLNKGLIRHPFATFFVRASGDSMVDAEIRSNATSVVDRAIETKSGDIAITRIGDELCAKESFLGRITFRRRFTVTVRCF